MVRKLGALATVAMTLMLAACTSATAPPPPRTVNGVVAWISTPAPPTTSTTSTTTMLAPAPYCSVSSLRVRRGYGGGAMGNVVIQFYLTNVGKVTCRLSGYPTLSAITTTGKRLSLKPQHGTYF